MSLSAYSAMNIVVVSFFRYRNGNDGAMGEWYNSQTHFIAIGVVYFCAALLSNREGRARAVAVGVLIATLISAVFGYMFDWRKGEYVADYKRQFVQQAPVILAFPDLIADKHNVRETMLWDYSVVKPTIDFLYQHKLWIFHRNGPIIEGVELDGWMRSDKGVSIICPAGSSSLSLRIWRKEEWPASAVVIYRGGEKESLPISGKLVEFKFPTGIPALRIDASDTALSKPITSESDTRPNVGIVSDVACR